MAHRRSEQHLQPRRLRARAATAVALSATLVLALSACAGTARPAPRAAGDPLLVVTTISIFADLARAVGGADVEAVTVVPVGGDPHTYEPRPSDARLLAGADLILTNGLGLTPTLDPLVDAAGRKVPVVVLSDGLTPIVQEAGTYAGDPDPHLWMDPTLVRHYVANLTDGLTRIAPDRSSQFTAGAAAYQAELDRLDRWIHDRVATIPPGNARLVTTHDAFRYFTARYPIERTGSVFDVSTESEPSATDLAELVAKIRSQGVPAVFVETTINPQLMRRVARDAGTALGEPLYGDSVGEPGSGAETYEEMMRTNTRHIVTALGGTVSEP